MGDLTARGRGRCEWRSQRVVTSAFIVTPSPSWASLGLGLGLAGWVGFWVVLRARWATLSRSVGISVHFSEDFSSLIFSVQNSGL